MNISNMIDIERKKNLEARISFFVQLKKVFRNTCVLKNVQKGFSWWSGEGKGQ